MYLKHIIIIILIHMIWVNQAWSAASGRAVRKLESAFRACENGMEMTMPKSKSALRILQGRLKRYQRNRDAALRRDDSLKTSEDHYYTGSFFGEKTFSELFELCESEFIEKVAQSEKEIAEKMEDRLAQREENQAKLEELIKKNNAARRAVVLAINEYCAGHLRNLDEPSSTLKEKYQTAKQEALTSYPDVVKQFHQATVTDISTGQEKNLNKTVKAWFDYCDAVFTGQVDLPTLQKNAVKFLEAESPMPPTTQEEISQEEHETVIEVDRIEENQEEITETEAVENDVEKDDAQYQAELKAEYEAVLATLQADKLKVLQEEGRLPDYSDNEDNDLKKAATWQYEKEDANQCSTYRFSGEKLLGTDTTPGECPPF